MSFVASSSQWNYVIAELTHINQAAAADFGKPQTIKPYERQNKMLPRIHKTFVFKNLYGVVSSPVHNVFWYEFVLHIKRMRIQKSRAKTQSWEANRNPLCFLRLMISHWMSMSPRCNGWMCGSSLSLRFALSSTVLWLLWAAPPFPFVHCNVGQECTSVAQTNKLFFVHLIVMMFWQM